MSNVSIVIPTRNRLPLLQDAVASVERQTLQDLELVVIDDASEYGTSDWLGRRSGAGLRHIRLETPSERSAALNRGLDAATGEFVLFLDDDDRLLPTALETLVSGLRRHPHSIAVVGAYVMFDASGNRRRAGHPRREIQRHVWQDALFLWAATPSRILFRTEVIRAAGGFRAGLSFAEDRELWLRATRQGCSCALC